MNKKFVSAALVILNISGLAMANTPTQAKEMDKNAALTAGEYTAKVKALVCEGCPPVVEQTLKKSKGINNVSVDQKTSMVTFKVNQGARIKVADLQKNLRAASNEMGMGADYELYELKALKKADKVNDRETK